MTAAVAYVNLTAAAKYVLTCRADLDLGGTDQRHVEGAYFAALDMWQALTGLTDDAALAYARTCVERPTTAQIAPF